MKTKFDYKPLIFNAANEDNQTFLKELFDTHSIIRHDTIEMQLKELFEIRNASQLINKADIQKMYANYSKNIEINHYGEWVYYPWKKTIVHILPKEEFWEVKTSRNKHKILEDEQAILRTKKVGIVGLSVGQSVALTIAQENAAGVLRIADFDNLELSNLNRIRSGIDQLGIPKIINTARAIAEIDPYMEVDVYPEGITHDNIDDFFTKNGILDVIIDECDSIDIKVLLRNKAKLLGVPVIMETSDRGMIDIERYDLEPDRPILHGLVGDISTCDLKGMANEDKIPFALKIAGAKSLSIRMKASMLEIDNSINTWPQLAADVVMGGGITANICRKILLREKLNSGRTYIDLDTLLFKPNGNEQIEAKKAIEPENRIAEINHFIQKEKYAPDAAAKELSKEFLKKLIRKSCRATSGGNLQSWEFIAYPKSLYLLLHPQRVSRTLDSTLLGAHVALGAILENIKIISQVNKLKVCTEWCPFVEKPEIIARITFYEGEEAQKSIADMNALLFPMISRRKTNRKINSTPIHIKEVQRIKELVDKGEGSKLLLLTEQEKIRKLADLMGRADRLRMTYKAFHKELMSEIRWTEQESIEKRIGIYIGDLELKKAELTGISLAKDWEVMQLLGEINGGQGLEKMSRSLIEQDSVMGLLVCKQRTSKAFFDAGQLMQKAWLYSTYLGIDWHPLTSLIYLLSQLDKNVETCLPSKFKEELLHMRSLFLDIFHLNEYNGLVLLTRFVNTDHQLPKSLRLPIESVLFFEDEL